MKRNSWIMRFGPRAITIVNAVLLIAASSTSVLAPARMPTAAGLWEKLDSSGQPEAEFRITDCNGLYQGKIVKIFPRPGENPSTFRCTECEGEQKNAPVVDLTLVKGCGERASTIGTELFSIRTTALSTVPLLSVAAFHELKNPGEGRPLDFDRREDVACCDEVGEALRFYWIMWHCRRLQGDYVHRQQCICCNVERHLSSLVGDSMYFASSEK
jgi:hypothetical protein